MPPRRCTNTTQSKKPKKEPNTQLSGLECIGCGKGIKARLVRLKRVLPKRCYECWLKASGKPSRKAQKKARREAVKLRREAWLKT